MKADTMTKEALQKMTPTPLFEEPLKFIAHGHIFERFQQLCYGYLSMSSVYAFGLCTQLKTSLVIKFFLRRAKRMMFVLAVYYQYYVLSCWICVYEFGLHVCTQLKTSLVIKWKELFSQKEPNI